MDATDQALLREFATRRCEKSFRQLVDRHLAMVFAVSERVTNDRSLAEDIAQSTFATLAEKAPALEGDTVVAGWLYHTARNLAMMAVRSDIRRRQREEIAAAMNINEPGPNVVAEHLESAMDQLKPEDRDALVLRYFEDRSLRDIGLEFGLSEDAARMRVNRSLERLRGIFGKLGIAGSAAWLVATLPASTSAAVPVGLGASITTAVLSGTAIAATAAVAAQTTSSTMNLLNFKFAAAVVAAATVAGTSTYLVKERQADHLEAKNRRLEDARAKLVDAQRDSAAAIQLRDEQIEELRKTTADVPRLRGEVDKLNRNLGKVDRLETENRQLHETINSFRPEEFADFERFMQIYRARGADQAEMLKIPYLKLLGDSLELAANKNGGTFPKSLDAAKPYMGDKFYGGIEVMGRRVRADDFEICFQGDLKSITNPAATKILQESIPYSFDQNVHTENGSLLGYRGLYFADGHVEIVKVQDGPDGWKVVKEPDPSEGFE